MHKVFRTYRTTQEIRANSDPEILNVKFRKRFLPNEWDEFRQWQHPARSSWKRNRLKQYKVKDVR